MHMAFEADDNKTMLIGFIISLIVGLNVILFFGNIIDFNSSVLTGAAVFSCTDVSGGIKCGNEVFTAANGVCPAETVKVCTNSCELTVAYTGKDSVCPAACGNVCVPKDILDKI